MSAVELAALIHDRQPCVVLTGAGVSTESGIPDFRSPSGLWATFDPLEYGSIEAFRADPLKVWSFYKPRVAMLTEAEPNPAHLALAELERRGFVEAVVTQNIDLLPGNLLVRNGRLTGVIDWGSLGVGDPACDLIPAWGALAADARDAFRAELGVDDATWARGRGWALSIGLVALPYYVETNRVFADTARVLIRETLADHEAGA